MTEIFITILIATLGIVSGWLECFDKMIDPKGIERKKINFKGIAILLLIITLTAINSLIVKIKDDNNDTQSQKQEKALAKLNEKADSLQKLNIELANITTIIAKSTLRENEIEDYKKAASILMIEIDECIDLLKNKISNSKNLNSNNLDSTSLDLYIKILNTSVTELLTHIGSKKDPESITSEIFNTAKFTINHLDKDMEERFNKELNKFDSDKIFLLKKLNNLVTEHIPNRMIKKE